jgi:hypothetical protein
MGEVDPYHSSKDPRYPVYHVYDDCPAGERITKAGDDVAGDNNWLLCKFGQNMADAGKFLV